MSKLLKLVKIYDSRAEFTRIIAVTTVTTELNPNPEGQTEAEIGQLLEHWFDKCVALHGTEATD